MGEDKLGRGGLFFWGWVVWRIGILGKFYEDRFGGRCFFWLRGFKVRWGFLESFFWRGFWWRRDCF